MLMKFRFEDIAGARFNGRYGKPLTMNLRSDDKFVEDEGWHQACERYEEFLRTRQGKILYLELGV